MLSQKFKEYRCERSVKGLKGTVVNSQSKV